MQTKSAAEDLQNYLTDASNMQGGYAAKLFIPESADEISAILKDANESGIPVTISGARTGTVGGAVPFGGYVISMERLNGIKSIDREKSIAVVEPGVILRDFQQAVDAEGLFYPPDPTEWSCQIGGTIATNASGARSFMYGPTRYYVNRLRLVLADGIVLDLTRGQYRLGAGRKVSFVTEGGREIDIRLPSYEMPNVRKNVSGYYAQDHMDPMDVFIGSEGTLGVITEAELSLMPKPESTFSGIVFFAKESDLLAFANYVRAARHSESQPAPVINASLLEYFDDRALKFISEKFPETPSGMAGAIFFEQETTALSEEAIFEAWNELLEKHEGDIDRSWFTTSDQDRAKMREFRHALPVSVNEFIARHNQRKVGTDMSVPDDKFAGFLRFYKEILGTSGIDYVIFGHIGDCHLHANLLPKDDAEAEKARHIYGRCVAQAVMLGGTVSAEHGIGKLKSKYLQVMMGERYLNEMAEVKRSLDPKGILGRGNMFQAKLLG